MRPEDLEKLAWWMDEAFRIPGTRIRFGIDAIVGLFPGLGEWITSLVQAALVMGAASQRDLPNSVVLRMVLNVAIDSIVGAIPFFGDIFDVFFKASRRNVNLLREVNAERRNTGRVSARRHFFFLAGVMFALLFILVSTGYAAFQVATWLFEVIARNVG